MRVAVMQPYFVPYFGYFQLLHAVDRFVIYDDVQFTRSGWIHRNRIAVGGAPSWITLALRRDSDTLPVRDRALTEDFRARNAKLLRRVEGAYRSAPFFEEVRPLLDAVFGHHEPGLFAFVRHSVEVVAAHLGIETPLVTSSSLGVDPDLRGQDRVLAMAEAAGARTYVNPPGGVSLYDAEAFQARGMDLRFLQPAVLAYAQGAHEFLPSLSILDVLVHNPLDRIRARLDDYALTDGAPR